MSFFAVVQRLCEVQPGILQDAYFASAGDSYCRLLLSQYFEGRYLPLIAPVFCLGALLTMQNQKKDSAPLLARIFLAGALAALGFSMFRLTLGAIFNDALIWADFWEEVTELMFVACAAVILWVYREGLLDVPVGRNLFKIKTI